TYASRLAESLRRRGLVRRDSGDRAGASADTRRALEALEALPSRSGEGWFAAACCRATLARLAGRAGSRELIDAREREAAGALEGLRRAIDLGYRDLAAFRTEPALEPLRSRDDFRALMMDLAFPPNP